MTAVPKSPTNWVSTLLVIVQVAPKGVTTLPFRVVAMSLKLGAGSGTTYVYEAAVPPAGVMVRTMVSFGATVPVKAIFKTRQPAEPVIEARPLVMRAAKPRLLLVVKATWRAPVVELMLAV